MIVWLSTQCPYCNSVQKYGITIESMNPFTKPIYCNMDFGGCGKLFAIEVKFSTSIKSYVLKESEGVYLIQTLSGQ